MRYQDYTVPQDLIDDIRLYTQDRPDFNELIEGNEASDEEIDLAVRLYVDHFASMPPPVSREITPSNFPDAYLMIQGACIELLRMKGLFQTRNFLNFRDSNTDIQLNDKAKDYQSWIQSMIQENRRNAEEIKKSINAREGWDFQPSPESRHPFI